MARTIEFDISGTVVAAEMHKVDRSKLYGSVEVETLSIDGEPCTLATLASDGRTLVPHGGTAMGYVNDQGEWVNRSDLVAVDLLGSELPQVESSFSAPIEALERVDLDTFLDHSIRLVYRLEVPGEGGEVLSGALEGGAILRLPFSYRGGVEADPAFLLADGAGEVWFLVGNRNDVELVGLDPVMVGPTAEDDDSPDDGGDPLDFGML